MRGTMLWFNAVKDFGMILTDEGEKLAVHGSGFAEGKRPEGRCAKAVVSFSVVQAEDGDRAEGVVFVPDEPRRRARHHHSTIRARF